MRALAILGLLAATSLLSQTALAQAARPGALADLNGRIDAEAVARMAADQALRDSLTESRLIGRYAVAGMATCLRSSTGFNPDMTPRLQAGTSVQGQTISVSGVATFAEDGTATFLLTNDSVVLPGGGTSGAVVRVDVRQSYTYAVGADSTLLLTKVGSTVGVVHRLTGDVPLEVTDGPNRTGRISKDWRSIALFQDALAVEEVLTNNTPPALPRVCNRSTALYKLAD